MSNFLTTFLEFLSQIRLYHWQTTNYARHIAAGTLYDQSSLLIDQFIETYQGKHITRLKSLTSLSIKNLDDEDIISYLFNFKGFLMEDLEEILDDGMKNTDLLNIRDEILGLVNHTLYLFTLQ